MTTKVDIRALEDEAIEKYVECPKLPTIVRFADMAEDGQLHCVVSFTGPPKPNTNPFQRDFTVPQQKVQMVVDKVYGLFSVIRVISNDGKPYTLVTSTNSRIGFLLSDNRVEFEESPTKSFQSAISTSWFLHEQAEEV